MTMPPVTTPPKTMPQPEPLQPTKPAAPSGRMPVPVRLIGSTEVPRLFLGDNGFLAKLDSRLTDAEIIDRMSLAASLIALGVAAGDERLLGLARVAGDRLGRRIPLMHHSDLPLMVGDQPLPYGRCAATIRHSLVEEHHINVGQDPVLGFLDHFVDRDPLTPDECKNISLDLGKMEAQASVLPSYSPSVITIGGDYLDLLHLVGREDLAHEGLTRVRDNLPASDVAIVATLYVGALVDASFDDLVDGIMVPINRLGVAMLPNRDVLTEWSRHLKLPLIAMHVLAAGAIDPTMALQDVDGLGVTTAVIGASRRESIMRLAEAARIAFRSANQL
jgi:hypothetical protein